MTPSIPQLSPHDLSARLNADSPAPLVLDVRTPLEFQEMHLDAARLAPLDDLDAAALAREEGPGREIVVICRGGGRAKKAAEKLATAGMSCVFILEGGLLAWSAAGLPVTRGHKVISLERQVRIAAGALVVIGAVLAHFVHPAWIGLSAFVGAGLVFAGITDTCGLGMILARMPWNNRCTSGSSCCSVPK